MDSTLLRAAILVVLMIGFIGTWIWAWSRKRKPEFDRAARMPLEEDAVRTDRRGADED